MAEVVADIIIGKAKRSSRFGEVPKQARLDTILSLRGVVDDGKVS